MAAPSIIPVGVIHAGVDSTQHRSVWANIGIFCEHHWQCAIDQYEPVTPCWPRGVSTWDDMLNWFIGNIWKYVWCKTFSTGLGRLPGFQMQKKKHGQPMSMGWETVWTAQGHFFLPRRQVRTQAAKIRPKSARNPLTIPSRRVTGILIWSGAMITASHFGPNAEDFVRNLSVTPETSADVTP